MRELCDARNSVGSKGDRSSLRADAPTPNRWGKFIVLSWYVQRRDCTLCPYLSEHWQGIIGRNVEDMNEYYGFLLREF
ncbi:unnamed protein product [Calypogeia fissa]